MKGWGSATTGGAYTITSTATLGSVSSTSTDTRVTFALDKVPKGGGSYSKVFGRQVGSCTCAASVWVQSTGAVALVLTQGATVLSTTTVTGLTYTPGAVLAVRLQVTSTAPTTLRAKLWLASQSESVWLATATDSTAALQVAGSVGVQSYLSGTASAGVITQWDHLLVTPTS